MKILALSDRVVDAIYSPQVRDLYGDAELVVGCGDLPYYYLEYVVTMLNVPVLYVYGNHDKTQYMSDGRRVVEPEGCISLEGRTLRMNGTLLAGLGGSMRYQPNAINQFTETEMWLRALGLMPQLLLNRVRHGRFLDVLVTHSPPYGIHDGEDLPHRGFKVLLTLMKYFKPKYMLHGHTHLYRRDTIWGTQCWRTRVRNVYPARLIDTDAGE